MRNSNGWWIIVAIMLLLDVYVFQVVKYLTQGAGDKTRLLVHGAFWLVSGVALLFMVLIPFVNYDNWPKAARTYIFAMVVGLFFAKLIGTIFFFADDVRRGIMWVVGKAFSNPSVEVNHSGEGISRSTFMSWLGIGVGGTLFGSLLFGFRNKYNYRLEKLALNFSELPAAFKGLKIVHISDIHSGSLQDEAGVRRGIEMIMKEKPDLILFTGDLVNDRATEMDPWKQVFGSLKAPMGVYSTLGNHDYGDYVSWESNEVKVKNLEALKAVHAEMGWRLLMNEHVVLEKEGQQIAILGIENWGAKGRFPKYGKMDTAYPGTENIPFKILMSHDPSHWDAQVRTTYPDVQLMLAGHTHGMQFGVEMPGFKWSPVQYMYKQWGGLYEEGTQKLYVNRGFGFIGYPGRVGILPEITVFTLA